MSSNEDIGRLQPKVAVSRCPKIVDFKTCSVLIENLRNIVCEFWYNKEGHTHRDNGLPAVVESNGAESYYINGFLVKTKALR